MGAVGSLSGELGEGEVGGTTNKPIVGKVLQAENNRTINILNSSNDISQERTYQGHRQVLKCQTWDIF